MRLSKRQCHPWTHGLGWYWKQAECFCPLLWVPPNSLSGGLLPRSVRWNELPLYKLPVVLCFVPAIRTQVGLGPPGHSAGAQGGGHLGQPYSKDWINPFNRKLWNLVQWYWSKVVVLLSCFCGDFSLTERRISQRIIQTLPRRHFWLGHLKANRKKVVHSLYCFCFVLVYFFTDSSLLSLNSAGRQKASFQDFPTVCTHPLWGPHLQDQISPSFLARCPTCVSRHSGQLRAEQCHFSK